MVPAMAGPSRSSWRQARKRSSKAISDEISSRTSSRGGKPASSGCSPRSRWAKACNVPIAAESISSSASRQRAETMTDAGGWLATAASSWRMRSRSSVAAFSVKVIAAISVSGIPLATIATTRATRIVVLPEPAPASTNSVASSSSSTALRTARSSVATVGWTEAQSAEKCSDIVELLSDQGQVGGQRGRRALRQARTMAFGGAEAVGVAIGALDERPIGGLRRVGGGYPFLDAVGGDGQSFEKAPIDIVIEHVLTGGARFARHEPVADLDGASEAGRGARGQRVDR